ncbi:unnamed protein product, partial [Brachionus calyciflorus]
MKRIAAKLIINNFNKNSPALLDTVYLEEVTFRTVSQAVIKRLNKYDINFENVFSFVSDNTSYMFKSYNNVSINLVSNSHHTTYVAHIIAVIADTWRILLKKLDKLVGLIKFIFSNSPARRIRHKAFLQELNVEKANLPTNGECDSPIRLRNRAVPRYTLPKSNHTNSSVDLLKEISSSSNINNDIGKSQNPSFILVDYSDSESNKTDLNINDSLNSYENSFEVFEEDDLVNESLENEPQLENLNCEFFQILKLVAEDEEFRRYFRYLKCLPFIPVKYLINVFCKLNSSRPESIAPIYDYFEKYYIGLQKEPGSKVRIVPDFPIKTWNVHKRVLENLPRSNNSLEAWHKAVAQEINSHPEINKLVNHFIKEQHLAEICLEQIKCGYVYPRNSKELKRDQAIISLYDNFDKSDYLEFMDKLNQIL